MSVPFAQTAQHRRTGRPVYDMAMPFDPNALRRTAEEQGMTRHDAAVFAHLALSKLRTIYKETGQPVTRQQIAEAMRDHAMEELEQTKPTEEELQAQGVTIADAMDLEVQRASPTFALEREKNKVRVEEVDDEGGTRRKRLKFKFSDDGLEEYFGGQDPYADKSNDNKDDIPAVRYRGRDILTMLCDHPELAVEIGKHLRPEDIINLYIASPAFHHTVNGHLLSTIKAWTSYKCPDASRVFAFNLYKRHLVLDPARRTWAQQYNISSGSQLLPRGLSNVRSIPGLKYLQLVTGRDRYCREIIAIMARNGHRMPPTMHRTLLRLWLLMDVATTHQRKALLRNKDLWTDTDLYNAQFLFIKLGMHFNDPIYGPNSYELLHLILGQKGLFPLWQLLMRKRFTRLPEILELKARYDLQVPADHWGGNYFDRTIHGVPFDDVGLGHLEGWGMGSSHLHRPDELIPAEAVMRGLELDQHLMHMVTWGYIDWHTGENLVPTSEEMYISDSEEALAHTDITHHWKERHVLKKRFYQLTPLQQRNIIEDDEDDRLRAMGWCGEGIDDYDSPFEDEDDEDNYSLDDEIDRGFILSEQPRNHKGDVPGLKDTDVDAWRSFSNKMLIGMPLCLSEDEELRAQAHYNYRPQDLEVDEEYEEGDKEDEEEGPRADGDGNGDDMDVDEMDYEYDEAYDDDDVEGTPSSRSPGWTAFGNH